jgi:hypothetical protein
MLWFYQKHDARLHYEIRRQADGDDYEIVITHPTGQQEVERYSDSHQLLKRSQTLQQILRSSGWQPLG